MTEEKVGQLVIMMKDSLPADKLAIVKQKIDDADDSKFDTLMLKKLYNPTQILLFSVFLGAFGVDRFVIKDTGLGVAKLILGWFTCGIWPLIDIFCCYKKAKEKNFTSIMLEL